MVTLLSIKSWKYIENGGLLRIINIENIKLLVIYKKISFNITLISSFSL